MELNKIHEADCRKWLRSLPDQSANCCVTSPPYFGLRDYGHDQQIGLESSVDDYIYNMVCVFHEIKRVLKDDGTLWLNLGDSYAGSSKGRNADQQYHTNSRNSKGAKQGILERSYNKGFKPKDLMGIPWRVAMALQQPSYICNTCRCERHAMLWGKYPSGRLICPLCNNSTGVTEIDGWYLRQDIIWYKPNPMPESVTDRCTKAHEYIFLLSKSHKYHYDGDAIRTPITGATFDRMNQQLENQRGSERAVGKVNGTMKTRLGPGRSVREGVDSRGGNQGSETGIKACIDLENGSANKKSVWPVTTKPFTEAHFATFPEDLIVDCIKAGCPENGVVIDPFAGAGTTPMVSRKLNRNFYACELNPSYIKIANKRLFNELGMFI